MEYSFTVTIPDKLVAILKVIYKQRVVVLILAILFIFFLTAYTKSEVKNNGTLNIFSNGDVIDSDLINENFTMLNDLIKSIYTTDITGDDDIDDPDKMYTETDGLVYKKSAINTVYTANYAEFDERLDILSAGAVPSNIIVMWYKSYGSIPYGWKICNGENGTPDLRGRSVIGASADNEAGLSDSYSYFLHKENAAPTHQHKYPHNHNSKTENSPLHNHKWIDDTDDNGFWNSYNSVGNTIADVFNERNRDYNLSGSGFLPFIFSGLYTELYTDKDDSHQHDLETSDPTKEHLSDAASMKPPLYPFYFIMKE